MSFTDEVEAIRIFLTRKLTNSGITKSSTTSMIRMMPGMNLDIVRIHVNTLPHDSKIKTTHRCKGGRPSLKNNLT